MIRTTSNTIRTFAVAAAFAALATSAAANPTHRVIETLGGYAAGKALDAHQEAGKRLGYPPLMPPVPGATSPNHKKMIEEVERQKRLREQRD
jgi:hypothetical protein